MFLDMQGALKARFRWISGVLRWCSFQKNNPSAGEVGFTRLHSFQAWNKYLSQSVGGGGRIRRTLGSSQMPLFHKKTGRLFLRLHKGSKGEVVRSTVKLLNSIIQYKHLQGECLFTFASLTPRLDELICCLLLKGQSWRNKKNSFLIMLVWIFPPLIVCLC